MHEFTRLIARSTVSTEDEAVQGVAQDPGVCPEDHHHVDTDRELLFPFILSILA